MKIPVSIAAIALLVGLFCSTTMAFQPRPPILNIRNHYPFEMSTRRHLESALRVAATSNRPRTNVETTSPPDSFLTVDRQTTTFEMPEIHNRTLTKTEQEFRELLGDFAHFSERDILSVPSPRMRILFEGVKASAGEPAVYRSFEVLFTDFLPIRMAGRLIYKKLLNVMEESQALRRQQVERVSKQTGLPQEEVDMLRIAFLSIAQENHYKDGQVFLSKKQLKESSIGDIVVQGVGYANSEAFFDVLDVNSDGRLSFEELIMGLYSNAEELCFEDESCDPSQVLHTLLVPLLGQDTHSHHRVLDAKHQKYSERYDEMIQAFAKWESQMIDTSGEGRQLDVLRGCFVGAKNEYVLEALRIVYVDYPPLRVAGNLIFKLMSALIQSRQ
jgi:hypothetical protein